MTKRSMLRLLGATAALNLVLLTSGTPKAFAADAVCARGLCQKCMAAGLKFDCCEEYGCGDTGQPACTCYSENDCP
jgi:hypothetical protein